VELLAMGTGSAISATTGAAASATSIASLLPSAATALTGLSALSMYRGGQATKISGRVEADQIKQDAKNKEVARRRSLVSSLASQNATRAASGIAFFEGSSADIALEDIRTGEGAILTERAGAGSAADVAIASGRSGYRRGVIGAGASLLDQANRNRLRG